MMTIKEQYLKVLDDPKSDCLDVLAAVISYLEELQTQIMAIKGIGFDTHPSWNCSEEFRAGWKACREQVEEAIK